MLLQMGKKTIIMQSTSKTATMPYAAAMPLFSATMLKRNGAKSVDAPDASDMRDVAVLLSPGAVPMARESVSG